MLILIILMFAGAGSALSIMRGNSYESIARLQVAVKQSPIALPNPIATLAGSGDGGAATQIEILKSRSIIGPAVISGSLHISVGEISPILSRLRLLTTLPWVEGLYNKLTKPRYISVESFIPSDRWTGNRIFFAITGPAEYEMTVSSGETAEGTVGTMTESPDGEFSIGLSGISGAVGDRFYLQIANVNDTITNIAKNNLRARELGQTGIIEVIYTERSPKQALRGLQEITSSLIEYDKNRAITTATTQLEEVEAQAPEAQRKLSEAINAERNVTTYNRDVEVAQEVYLLLMKHIQELRFSLAQAEGKITILDEPYVYPKPVQRSALFMAIVFGVLGGLLYIVSIALRLSWIRVENTVPGASRD